MRIETTFTLSLSQVDKLRAWMTEQETKHLALQRFRAHQILLKSTDTNDKFVRWANQVMNSTTPVSLTADGGYYIYSFHPTTLGHCVKVTHTVTKDSIDLTECQPPTTNRNTNIVGA